MKSIKMLSLATLSWVLIGCGSGSDGGPAPYNIDQYTGRSVSTADITGTWVVAADFDFDIIVEGESGSGNVFSKSFVVIDGDSTNGFFSYSCIGGAIEPISVSGSTITIEGDEGITLVGTLQNNSLAEISDSGTVTYEDFGIVTTTDYTIKNTMVKISDSTEPFGTLNHTSSESSDLREIACFLQSRGRISGGGESVTFKEFSADGLIIEKYSGAESYTYLEFEEEIGTFMFDTDFEESASYKHTVNSSDSESLTFSGSNDFESVDGLLEVDLP